MVPNQGTFSVVLRVLMKVAAALLRYSVACVSIFQPLFFFPFSPLVVGCVARKLRPTWTWRKLRRNMV